MASRRKIKTFGAIRTAGRTVAYGSARKKKKGGSKKATAAAVGANWGGAILGGHVGQTIDRATGTSTPGLIAAHAVHQGARTVTRKNTVRTRKRFKYTRQAAAKVSGGRTTAAGKKLKATYKRRLKSGKVITVRRKAKR